MDNPITEQQLETAEPAKKKSRFFSVRPVPICVLLVFLAFALYLKATIPYLPKPSLTKSKNVYALYQYGKAYDRREQFAFAEKYLKRALELDPNFHKALMELAVVYSEQGEYIKSIALLEKALKNTGGDAENHEIALYDLGKMYFFEKKGEEAWSYLNQAYEARKALGNAEWPDDHSDPAYYIKSQDKSGFTDLMKDYYPPELSERLIALGGKSVLFPRSVLKEYEEFLAGNPNSYYTVDIMLAKAYLLVRMQRHDKAIETLEALKGYPLDKDDKEWVDYAFYSVYFSAKKYDLALAALENLKNSDPRKYTGPWYKFEKSLIYKGKKDYDSEKKLLLEFVEADTAVNEQTRPRGPTFIRPARERLIEIFTVQRDYRSAFIQLSKLNQPLLLALGLLSLVLSVGFAVFLVFIYSRVFFFKKIQEGLSGIFRLRYLWLSGVVLSVIPQFTSIIFFWLNYITGDLLAKIRLDPFIAGALAAELLAAAFCVLLLKRKYRFDDEALGFVSKGARYNVALPLLAGMLLVLFGAGYERFITDILLLASPEHPMSELIEQFLSFGSSSQRVLFFMTVVVAGPLSEEIVFRLFLFTFLNRFMGRKSAVVLSALVFAMGHGEPALFIYYFVMAAALSWIYLKTKSIIPSIITHGLMNLIAFFAFLA